MLSLPTIGYFLIRQEKVQDYLVHRISYKLTEFLGAPISLSSATIDLFTNISLRDFCVQTPQHDTILYTPELTVRFNSFTLTSKYLELKKIRMLNPDINFYIDSAKNINFLFILKKLGLTDTTSSAKHPMVVSIKEIILKNADFKLESFNKIKRDSAINFTDLHLKSFNLTVKNFRLDRGVSMDIKECSGIEKSGFVLQQLTSQLKINKNNMAFNHLNFLTSLSNVKTRQVLFSFNNFKEFKPGVFGKNVKLNIELEPSEVASEDLAWFMPVLRNYNINVKASGILRGRFSDMRIKDLDVFYGKQTHFKGNIDISGLPNLSSSFLHVDIKSLYTIPHDIESIKLPKHKSGRLVLPEQFKAFTFLTYRGKFTGFINDFVAYGRLSSNLGSVESDLSLQPDTSSYLNFKGQIKADQFNLGQFLNKTDLLGNISLNAMVSGQLKGAQNVEAKCDGVINSFVINNYNYQNVKINGKLSNNTYDGSISVSDPNINCNFLGSVDLSKHIPVFKFQADVSEANLYKLNIDKKDTGAHVSFYVTTDFEGDNVDNLNGEIKLWNAKLRKSGKEIQISDFLMFTKIVNDTSRIILQSSFADAEISGTYQFKELIRSFRGLMSKFMPALSKDKFVSASNNNFKVEVNFKNTQQLTDFYIPGLYISKDSKLTGNYNPSKNDFNFLMTFPLLQHKSKKWYNVFINGKSNRDNYLLTSGCSALKLNNKWTLENFTITSGLKRDSMDVQIRWNNFDTVINKGDVAIKAFFKKSLLDSGTTVHFLIEPSKIVLNDSVWHLQSGLVSIDTSEMNIKGLVISNQNQTIKMAGSVSHQADKALFVELNDFNLSNLDSLVTIKKVTMGGIINGRAELNNLYRNPVVKASFGIDSFAVNNVSLGKTSLSAVYDNDEKNVLIEAYSERGAIKTLGIKGTYATITRKLDFNIDLNKLKLDIFRPFLSSLFSEVHGIATGTLTLTGDTKSPLLNGKVTAQKTSFIVNYLKTRYNFTHTIDIENNKFILKHIEVFDSNVNKAFVDGEIEYRNLKELNVDLTIDAKKFECLNTKGKDNSMFYGTAYASGNVSIKGTQRSLSMDINATTESPSSQQKTIIYIPLSTKTELAESNYIRFVSNKQTSINTDQYEKDKAREKQRVDIPTSPLKLDIRLNVTSEAEVQIVFDPQIGDIIRGTGTAKDLRMTLERGVFNMYGTYTVEQGSQYLFTMGNIFQRKFEIEEGGTITWNGNPLDAVINIQAIYGLTTSLYPLGLTTTNEKLQEKLQKNERVECRLFLKDKLMNPTIRYDINLPKVDQEIRNLFNAAVNTDEEISNQVLALLFAGFFIPTNSTNTNGSANTVNNPSGYSVAGTNGLEFLSNQLSRMLSQISKDFDIGINYRPGDPITKDQVAAAFSTQILNNKVLINGNVDVGGNKVTSSSSNIIVEGNVEVKLTPNGKLRLKAFNRSNESYYAEESQYTQGVGVSYKENFNTFRELFKRYYKILFTRKEEKTVPVTENTNDNKNGKNAGNE